LGIKIYQGREFKEQLKISLNCKIATLAYKFSFFKANANAVRRAQASANDYSNTNGKIIFKVKL
jgi:hypothetical protein